jgi:hypothetical protein
MVTGIFNLPAFDLEEQDKNAIDPDKDKMTSQIKDLLITGVKLLDQRYNFYGFAFKN